MTLHYRQGDVLLIEVPAEEAKGSQASSKTLALGEMSGHNHTLVGHCEVIEANNGSKYVKTSSNAVLHHFKADGKTLAEHKPIPLPDFKVYKVVIQRQYNPLDGRIMEVRD